MAITTGWELTGNHDLSFPCLNVENGAVHALTALHAVRRGIVEWSGAIVPGTETDPLLAPAFRVDGELVQAKTHSWERVERWIPSWRARSASDLEVAATICAPPAFDGAAPGAVYEFEVRSTARTSRELEVALEGVWRWSMLGIGSRRPLSGTNHLLTAAGGMGLVLEPDGGPAVAILAVPGGESPPERMPSLDSGEWAHAASANGEEQVLRVGAAVQLPAGGSAMVAFFLGVGPERDGAVVAAHALAHRGSRDLVRSARLDLARITRRVASSRLAGILNRNLLFNLFFGMGRAVDDDRIYPLASRSPACPGPAVVREREALLWTLPAVTLAEPHFARELLLRCFELYGHRAGERGRYIDGGVIEPGFALDQACAYPVALDRYVRETGDDSVAGEPIVQDVLRDVDAILSQRLHPSVLLCETEYLPSGEAAGYRYTTVGNAMLQAAALAISRHTAVAEGEPPPNFAGANEELAAAIWRHCTVEVDGLRILAFATDVQGGSAVYDDPEASLALLPFLGFCAADDPIWSNTMEWLRSDAYPHWLADRPVPGLVTRSEPGRAHLAGLCADMLGPRRDHALELIGRLALEGGVAARCYDFETGAAAAQPYHAPAAGLLAWSIWHALEAR